MKGIDGHLFPRLTHFKECFSHSKYLHSCQDYLKRCEGISCSCASGVDIEASENESSS